MSNESSIDRLLKPIAGLILISPILVVLIGVLLAWRAYALSVMWAWFIAPTFGLPELSIPVAIGVAMVVAMLAKQHVPEDKEEGQAKKWGRAFLGPAFMLLAGWIVTRFM